MHRACFLLLLASAGLRPAVVGLNVQSPEDRTGSRSPWGAWTEDQTGNTGIRRAQWPRLMKTAGLTVKSLLKGHTHMHVHRLHGRLGTVFSQKQQRKFVKGTDRWREPWLWEAHRRHINYTSFGGRKIYTLGFIREPSAWCVSKTHHSWWDPKKSDLSLNDFVDQVGADKCQYSMIKWFCGMGDMQVCDDDKHPEVILDVAKRNLEEAYDFVGIVEWLPASLSVLSDLAPNILTKKGARVFMEDDARHSAHVAHYKPCNSSVMAKVGKKMELDQQLYDHAVMLYTKKYGSSFEKKSSFSTLKDGTYELNPTVEHWSHLAL